MNLMGCSMSQIKQINQHRLVLAYAVICTAISLINYTSALHAMEEPSPREELSLETEDEAARKSNTEKEAVPVTFDGKKINAIIIHGNTLIPEETLRAKIPYRVGEKFKPHKSVSLIHSLYNFGYFNNVRVHGENVGENVHAQEMNLHITVEEKRKLEKVEFTGNKHLNKSDIEKKLKISDIVAVDQEELTNIADQLKKLYREKDYHNVTITPELELVGDDLAIAHFNIIEGDKTLVQRVFFKGNNHINSKKLRSLTFTREDWLFGFFNKAGSYQPDALEFDKYTLENFYHNHGFLTARVTDMLVEPCSKNNMAVTFIIDEGPQFIVSSVKAPGNEIHTEEEILRVIPIRPGQLYVKDQIKNTMELLRQLWGESGYIYADIEPVVVPDVDKKTVAIEFISNLGSKVFVNRINLIGNKKTHDNVIRRQIKIYEGDLLTTAGMEMAKGAVESLGYFDPQAGVNWKVNRLDEENADLNLIFKERPTGRLFAQMGFGGQAEDSPSTRFNVSLGMQDTNAFGRGLLYNITGNYSKQDCSGALHLFNPWIFDHPIGAGVDLFMRKLTYDDFHNTIGKPEENVRGGSGIVRFVSPKLNFVNLQFEAGAQRIKYNTIISAYQGVNPGDRQKFQSELDRMFQPGTLIWTTASFAQDFRNHPVMPTRGYQWLLAAKFGVPHSCKDFGFVKFEADAQWLTPLINEYDLVFKLHGLIGLIHTFKNHTVPYRELFHIGGPATVRGYLYGQIGPTLEGDSLGAQKALVVNAELQFPITTDQSIRGVLFFDGGAGWDTPYTKIPPKNNCFNFRAAIGFGIRLTNPTPVRIDVGFKLDRNKRSGEQASEVHFTMSQDF
jgi:outer membrane protein assembly complex, YaeT protein